MVVMTPTKKWWLWWMEQRRFTPLRDWLNVSFLISFRMSSHTLWQNLKTQTDSVWVMDPISETLYKVDRWFTLSQKAFQTLHRYWKQEMILKILTIGLSTEAKTQMNWSKCFQAFRKASWKRLLSIQISLHTIATAPSNSFRQFCR